MTAAVHTIRLGDPWEARPGKGGTLFVRRFGKPTTHEPVWLIIDGLEPGRAVVLNGEPLNPRGTLPFAADVTTRLLPRNELHVSAGGSDRAFAVRLEIRPPG